MLVTQLQKIAATSDHTYDKSLGMLKSIFQTRDPDYLKREPAAVCVLFAGADFRTSEILLTMRSGSVATHANQVAFPGGSLEPGDHHDPKRAAARECFEEVGVPEGLIHSHAVLDAYPTFGGSFLVHPVLATVEGPGRAAPLIMDPAEVVFAEWVSVAKLMESRQVEERVVFGNAIKAPYFMWGDRKMWGLSAWIFDSILNRYVTIST